VFVEVVRSPRLEPHHLVVWWALGAPMAGFLVLRRRAKARRDTFHRRGILGEFWLFSGSNGRATLIQPRHKPAPNAWNTGVPPELKIWRSIGEQVLPAVSAD